MLCQAQLDVFLFLITGSLLLLVLTVSLLIFFRIYLKRIRHQQQKQFELEVAYREELLFKTIESIEQERRRIAIDLHDELGSILAILVRQHSTMQNEMRQVGTETIDQCRQLAEKGLSVVRTLAHTIMPPELELFGIGYTLENLRYQLSSVIEVQYTFTATGTPSSKKQDLAMYRIVQELVSNTLKHSGATALAIELSCVNGLLTMNYRDNGCGMQTGTPAIKNGMGLKNIEGRVNFVHGSLEIENNHSSGFFCRVKMPAEN